jgi:hypothetical protein
MGLRFPSSVLPSLWDEPDHFKFSKRKFLDSRTLSRQMLTSWRALAEIALRTTAILLSPAWNEVVACGQASGETG